MDKGSEDESKKDSYMKRMEEEDKRAEEIRLKTSLNAAKNETRLDKYSPTKQASVQPTESSGI